MILPGTDQLWVADITSAPAERERAAAGDPGSETVSAWDQTTPSRSRTPRTGSQGSGPQADHIYSGSPVHDGAIGRPQEFAARGTEPKVVADNEEHSIGSAHVRRISVRESVGVSTSDRIH